MNRKESILVFSAHSDDFVIGAGGTIAKYVREGKKVQAIVFTYGEKSHPWLKGEVVQSKVFPKSIAFNLLPQIDTLMDNGFTKEEMKMRWETQKIFADPHIAVNATAVRVPVFLGHGEAIHLETCKKIALSDARELLSKAPSVTLLDEREPGGYPTPTTEAASNDAVFVGRLREDLSHPCGLNFWVVADNIRKGAALNSIQIAERLIKDYL